MASEDANIQERQNVMDWDTYFMATAFLVRHRSKDPDCQVGACIVNEDKKIIGTGYNGPPIGFCDKNFPWTKNTGSLDNKHLYVCHAEMNAIIYRNTVDLKGCTIYVSLFPCNECAKIIIQSGIKKVIYFSDEKAHKPEYQAAKQMFAESNVDYIPFVPTTGQVNIIFSSQSLSN